MIAEKVDVSPATIRNRINWLEERGVIQGYYADINYKKAEGKLMNIFLCNAPTDPHDVISRILQVSGNLHLQAIGDNTEDLTRIKHKFANLDLEIEDEGLTNGEYYRPYDQYGPTETHSESPLTNFITLSGGAEVIEIPVTESASIAGQTIEDAANKGIFDDDVLVITIKRGDEIITPRGIRSFKPRMC